MKIFGKVQSKSINYFLTMHYNFIVMTEFDIIHSQIEGWSVIF